MDDGSQRISVLFSRYVLRNAFLSGQYPLNRFTRLEGGVQFNSIGRSIISLSQDCYFNGCTAPEINDVANAPAYNYVIAIRRVRVGQHAVRLHRLQSSVAAIASRFRRSIGNLKWVEGLADYRRYDPIIFNTITIATRLLSSVSVGRDEDTFLKYIGRPEYVRGYDNANFSGYECTSVHRRRRFMQHRAARRQQGRRIQCRSPVPADSPVRHRHASNRPSAHRSTRLLRRRTCLEQRPNGFAHEARGL